MRKTENGFIELVRPQDVERLVLHPAGDRLTVRRSSGAQHIETYDLDTGILEQIITPATASFGLLEYTQDGNAIISGFQRFDTATGDVLFEDLHYGYDFQGFYFGADSETILTSDGNRMWRWNIATGEVIQRETIDLRGNVLSVWPDGTRYLTTLRAASGGIGGIEIVNIGAAERRSLFF